MNDASGGGGATGALLVPEVPLPVVVPVFDADPGSVTGFGEDLRAASTQVDDFGGFVPGQAQAPDWIGEAGDAYRADIRPRGRRADALSLALRDVANRVLRHADQLTTLVRDHEDLMTDRARLHETVIAFNGDGAFCMNPGMLMVERELDLLARLPGGRHDVLGDRHGVLAHLDAVRDQPWLPELLTWEEEERARRNFELLKNDPNHPSLHFKKIGKYRSVRVGQSALSVSPMGRNASSGW